MHECTEWEMRETDRVWKTRGSQTLAVRLDAVTGSMLIPLSIQLKFFFDTWIHITSVISGVCKF